jgi:hydrogenase maturation protein HypF
VVDESKRIRVDVRGVVQGVGFRPFVFDLATSLGLSGWVLNTSDGVTAEVQGAVCAVQAFLERLVANAPPLAFIVQVDHRNVNLVLEETGFGIRASQRFAKRSALLPPDVCVCDDCLRELLDPADRRHRYPFINCTNCGPRYTIIDDIPYDRDKTSMAGFAMCDACRREYEDPRDRRFHAQPNACFECGPRVWLTDAQGHAMESRDPIQAAGVLLKEGRILAIKGLGGFHLAVDATCQDAVRRLRERKHREAKPLAVMCRDLEEACQHVRIDPWDQALITSRHRPIVLLPRKPESNLAQQVAPGNPDVGVMLPYTPLHVLLLEVAPPTLVMTSGNVSEEPIAIGNEEALQRLGEMADAFLLHDRDILVRNDDSVVRMTGERSTFLRRSRGYVPLPIVLRNEGPSVIGVGAELKNTVCLVEGRMAFLSQHVGDQSNAYAVDAFVDTVERLQRIVDSRPVCLGVDMHPDYATTRWAEAQDLPRVAVQHHHAHIAACLAEHQEPGPVIGVALDGTGYGTDGAIWGGELMVADLRTFRRAGHLAYVGMPGGDRAAQQPWRMAVSYLMDAYGEEWPEVCPESLRAIALDRRQAIAQLLRTGMHTPRTSSTGRLFDGVAAICGLVMESRFEAEAAMALERMAREGRSDRRSWPVDLVHEEEMLRIPPSQLIRPVVEDLARGVAASTVAMRFHRTLAQAWVDACGCVREETGISTVAASGGSLQNAILSELLIVGLREHGFRVLVPERVPPNDGGIALGQATVARCRFRSTG